MNDFARKTRVIYLPILLISALFITLYTLLHWSLILDMKLFSLKEDMVQFWLPFGLSCLPIIIWIRPRIKLLQLERKNGKNWATFYYCVIWFAIAIPTVIAQFYIQTATGKLTKLENMADINGHAATKYYTAKDYFVDLNQPCYYGSSEVSGRYNEDLNFYIHVALPILASEEDTAGSTCVAWLGVEYSKTVSNNLSDEKKEKEWTAFAEVSDRKLNDVNIDGIIYLEREGNTDDHDKYIKAIAKTPRYTSKGNVVLVARYEPFDARNGETLGWIFKTYAICMLLLLVMLIRPKMSETVVKSDEDTSTRELLALLVPSKGLAATPIIVDLNLLVFLLMAFKGLGFVSFHTDDLLYWGANYRPAVENGQWWRLFSSTFLHGGIMHLIANMYGLVFAGMFLEPVIGTRRFAIAYVATGLLASGASLWWHPATVSVGASGAIFGIYGVLLLMLLRGIFPKGAGAALLASTAVFVAFNLLMGLAGNGIDNAAHIGGLLSGLLIGQLFYPALKKEKEAEEKVEKTTLVDDTGDV